MNKELIEAISARACAEVNACMQSQDETWWLDHYSEVFSSLLLQEVLNNSNVYDSRGRELFEYEQGLFDAQGTIQKAIQQRFGLKESTKD